VVGQGEEVRAFIALGSNIGDRVGNIRRAVDALEVEGGGVKVTRTGRMYESEPMYVEDQDRFINTVIEVCLFSTILIIGSIEY
jgi:dihydroneopterin aldolase/2-amino-4-hydroxy-6-hydroxymethyldihydropteridine diphosphokinase/dihydropteroate synthase